MTTLNTRHGEVELRLEKRRYWSESEDLHLARGEVDATVSLPNEDDADALAEGVTVEFGRYQTYNAGALADAAVVVAFASDLAAAINGANAAKIDAARRAKAEAEAEAIRKREEREATIEARKEQLMVELIGEEVKVRERGYKTARIAVVDVVEITTYNRETYEREPTGEYRVRFNYRNDERTQRVEQIQRLDVRVGSKWQTVWDDGDHDVWGELAASAKPTGVQYDGALQGG